MDVNMSKMDINMAMMDVNMTIMDININTLVTDNSPTMFRGSSTITSGMVPKKQNEWLPLSPAFWKKNNIRIPLSRSVRGGKECVSLYSQTDTHAREGDDRQKEKTWTFAYVRIHIYAYILECNVGVHFQTDTHAREGDTGRRTDRKKGLQHMHMYVYIFTQISLYAM